MREITTDDELRALPRGSVFLDWLDQVWRVLDHDEDMYEGIGTSQTYGIARVQLPAQLLYSPTDPDEQHHWCTDEGDLRALAIDSIILSPRGGVYRVDERGEYGDEITLDCMGDDTPDFLSSATDDARRYLPARVLLDAAPAPSTENVVEWRPSKTRYAALESRTADGARIVLYLSEDTYTTASFTVLAPRRRAASTLNEADWPIIEKYIPRSAWPQVMPAGEYTGPREPDAAILAAIAEYQKLARGHRDRRTPRTIHKYGIDWATGRWWVYTGQHLWAELNYWQGHSRVEEFAHETDLRGLESFKYKNDTEFAATLKRVNREYHGLVKYEDRLRHQNDLDTAREGAYKPRK